MTDIDPAAVMAEHASHVSSQMRNGCVITMQRGDREPCDPYRLAEALAASEAKVARVRKWSDTCVRGDWIERPVEELDAALSDDPDAFLDSLADQPEQAS